MPGTLGPDATVVPAVSGHLGRAVLDQLAATPVRNQPGARQPDGPGHSGQPGQPAGPGQRGRV